jgi:hypothetical protein
MNPEAYPLDKMKVFLLNKLNKETKKTAKK